MTEYQSEQDFLAHYNPDEFERVSVTADMLIFGISNKETENYRKLNEKKLSLLMIRRDKYPFLGKWNLPGGFVDVGENLEAAAERILKRETYLDKIYMEQLYTFGKVNRDPRMRILATAYMSLINREEIVEELSPQALWFDITSEEKDGRIIIRLQNKEEKLTFTAIAENNGYRVVDAEDFAFDHAEIIITGLMRLKNKVNYTDIAFHLVPEYFTLTELQMVYESILGEKLLPAAFRRIISEKVEATDQMLSGAGHRPSRLFKYR